MPKPVLLPRQPNEADLKAARAEARYLVPASNQKGESRAIQVRLPPQITVQVDRLLSEALIMGKYPWKTPADVWRYLIWNGLQHLEEPLREIRGFLAAFALEQTLEHRRRAQQGIEEYLSDFRDQILGLKRHKSLDSTAQAQEMVLRTLEMLDHMPSNPDTAVLRRRFEEEWREFLPVSAPSDEPEDDEDA